MTVLTIKPLVAVNPELHKELFIDALMMDNEKFTAKILFKDNLRPLDHFVDFIVEHQASLVAFPSPMIKTKRAQLHAAITAVDAVLTEETAHLCNRMRTSLLELGMIGESAKCKNGPRLTMMITIACTREIELGNDTDVWEANILSFPWPEEIVPSVKGVIAAVTALLISLQ